MTVATTNVSERNLDQLIRRAMQMAGIMAFESQIDGNDPQWIQRASFGRDQLDWVLDRLQAEGVILRDVERYALPLVASTASYDLPVDTLDLHGDAMYLETGGSSEQRVTVMDREEYHSITDKALEGAPSRFWLRRLSICTVFLHPVPSTTGTLYVQRKKMLADSKLGTNTPDLERYWHDYLQWELAYRFGIASSLTPDSLLLLKGEAGEAKATAQNYARQFVVNQIELVHRTGWS